MDQMGHQSCRDGGCHSVHALGLGVGNQGTGNMLDQWTAIPHSMETNLMAPDESWRRTRHGREGDMNELGVGSDLLMGVSPPGFRGNGPKGPRHQK